jgi:hypothetical protein
VCIGVGGGTHALVFFILSIVPSFFFEVSVQGFRCTDGVVFDISLVYLLFRNYCLLNRFQ